MQAVQGFTSKFSCGHTQSFCHIFLIPQITLCRIHFYKFLLSCWTTDCYQWCLFCLLPSPDRYICSVAVWSNPLEWLWHYVLIQIFFHNTNKDSSGKMSNSLDWDISLKTDIMKKLKSGFKRFSIGESARWNGQKIIWESIEDFEGEGWKKHRILLHEHWRSFN